MEGQLASTVENHRRVVSNWAMKRLCHHVLCLFAISKCCAARAEDTSSWPHWRGPSGQGVVANAKLPDQWPATIEPVWKANLGAGWSSPVVAAGRVFVTDRQDGTERIIAFEAKTGKQLWAKSDPVDFDPHAVGTRHGNGPKSTPAVENGKVYALGIAGRLQCLRAADGQRIWEINFPARFGTPARLPGGRAFVNGTASVIVPTGDGQGAPVPLFGYTGSLLVDDGLVISSVGGAKGGTIMAFDADTGKEMWRALNDEVSYSSPVAARLAGIEQVVVMTGPEVVGLELSSGRKLWSYPFQIQYNESISTPLVADPYVIVTGDGRPLTALKIAPSGRGCSLAVAWENRDLSSYLSSMVIADGHVYGMNDGGEFGCVRISDGKTVWLVGGRSVWRNERAAFYATPLLAGSRILALDEQGRMIVLSASPKSSQPISITRLTERQTWSSPAVVGGMMYVRANEHLLAFRVADER